MPPASWPPSTATNHNSSAFIGQLGWPNLQTRIALLSARQAGQKICPQPEQRMPVPSGSNVCPHSEQHHSPDWIVKGILPNKCRLPEDLPCLLRCATGKTRRSSLPGPTAIRNIRLLSLLRRQIPETSRSGTWTTRRTRSWFFFDLPFLTMGKDLCGHEGDITTIA